MGNDQENMDIERDSRLLTSLDRGLRLLEMLCSQGGEQGVTALADQLGMSKAGVYRLLFTLEAHGFVQRAQQTGKYRLGMRIWEIGQCVVSELGLQQAARSVIEALARETGESIHIGVLDGNDVVYIDQAIGALPLQAPIFVGQRFPAPPLGIGKVLLAFGPEERHETVLRQHLERFTDSTITDSGAYRRELHAVRECGYALNRGEFKSEVSAIAAPIHDYRGIAIAALSISGPSTRYTDEHVKRLIPIVLRATEEISRQLGYLGTLGNSAGNSARFTDRSNAAR